MGLVIATAIALVAWIVLWAIGWSALDAFLVTTLIVTLGAMGRMLTSYLPGRPQQDH